MLIFYNTLVVAELQVASLITDDVVHRVLGHDPIESHGHWEASVWTGQEGDAGTKEQVLLILYGTNGHTEPIHLNKNTSFNPGSAVKVKVTKRFRAVKPNESKHCMNKKLI